MFLIKDWSGNILDYKGKFQLPCFAVPMEFESFEDGWDWIIENIDESCHDEVGVYDSN